MGVSEALMSTAAGIVVAVIATIFFNFFGRTFRSRSVALSGRARNGRSSSQTASTDRRSRTTCSARGCRHA